MAFFPEIKLPAFGLDIGDRSLKLVQLEKKGKKILLKSFGRIDVPEGYFEKGEPKEPKKIAELIRTLIGKVRGAKIKTSYVISVLPETKAYIISTEIPELPEKEMLGAIQEKIKYQVPLALEEVSLDWQALHQGLGEGQEVGASPEEGKRKILVAVAPTKIVEEYLKILHEASLIPLALEVESAAIARALVSLEKNASKRRNVRQELRGQAFVDIGATRSSIIFSKNGIVEFSASLPFAGQDVDKVVSQKLKLSLLDAEKTKIECGLDPEKCRRPLREVLEPAIGELVKKIKEAFSYYSEHFPSGDKMESLLLCGGGANMLGLAELLSKELGLEAKKAEPLKNISLPKKLSDFQNKALVYTTAIGLALRGELTD